MAINHVENSLFPQQPTLFVEVVLPVPLNKAFTYRVPTTFNEIIGIGKRVVAPLGRKKFYTGVVVSIKDTNSSNHVVKPIEDVLDHYPVFSNMQIRMMYWISEYYMTDLGQVLSTMLPAGFKISSESKIQLNPHFGSSDLDNNLSNEGLNILESLNKEPILTYTEVSNLLLKKNIYPVLKELYFADAILFLEDVKERYSPAVEKRFRFTATYWTEEKVNQIFEEIKSYKQQQIVLLYLKNLDVEAGLDQNEKGLAKKEITNNGLSESSLKTLIKNGIFELFDHIVPRVHFEEKVEELPELSKVQKEAFDQILGFWSSGKSSVLLHGATGSGKTMIYSELISNCIAQGEQVLLLMPEIALTSQMVGRLQTYFGDKMVVYHSRYSDNERVEIWEGVRTGRYQFVLGVRSSIFLPFRDLSLMIMDESHESSYKQSLMSPYYHTRSVVLVMAKIYEAKVLFGTATPSIETMYAAQKGAIGLVSLTQRFGAGSMPTFELIDLKKAKATKTINNAFTHEVLERVKEVIDDKKQVIVFQNQRGYAPKIICDVCGNTPHCPRCDIGLTYHLFSDLLMCHYCGHVENPHSFCLSCGGHHIKNVGYGTQQLEEDLTLHVDGAKVIRMDKDTTRSKFGHEKIIKKFGNQEANILVGTQMITKGLDFDKVRMVVVPEADRMLFSADFRAIERTYQVLSQVGGRAGRVDDKGLVLIQTYQPDHEVFDWVSEQSYMELYEFEIKEREIFKYPPFVRLIELTVKSKVEQTAMNGIEMIKEKLVIGLGKSRVLGPTKPRISRIRDLFIRTLLIKVGIETSTKNLNMIKLNILAAIRETREDKNFKSLRVKIDVDPL